MKDSHVAIVKNIGFMADLVDGLIKEADYSQAREIISGAIASLSADETDELLHCKNILCKVERADKSLHKALRIHREAYPLVQLSENHYLIARFHSGLGTTYEELGEYDRAFIEYEAARVHFEIDGDSEGAGYIENNVAFLSLALGLTEEARLHLEKARSYFTDAVKLAEIGVTEAQVYLKEGEPEKAVYLMLECLRTFERHGAKHLFDKSLDTLIKAACDYKLKREGQ